MGSAKSVVFGWWGEESSVTHAFNSWPLLDYTKTSIEGHWVVLRCSTEAVLRLGRVEGLNPIVPGREPLCFHLAKGHLFSVPALLLMSVTQHIKGTGIKGNLGLVRVCHRRNFIRDTSTCTEV